MMKVKNRATVIVILIVMVMFVTIPAEVYAAGNPYPDATEKTIGKTARDSVAFVKSHGGYKGIIKDTYYKKMNNGYYKKVVAKFKPSEKITRIEFLKTMANLYGEKIIPVTYSDVLNANSLVTDRYVKNKLTKVAKKLGRKIQWDNPNTDKLSRASVANYISAFAHFDKALMPKK